MNETSQVTSSGANGSSVSERAFVRSSTVDPRVVPDPGMQLPVADVERDHPRGASLEQHVREAAGRGAEVEAVQAGRVDAEHVEGVRELVPCPRDIRRRPVDLERCRLVDLLARLRVARYAPGHHERLGLSAALRETALDQEEIEAPPRHDVRAASPSTISARTDVSAPPISASRACARSAASAASARAPLLPTSAT